MKNAYIAIAMLILGACLSSEVVAQDMMQSKDGRLMGNVLDRWTEISPAKFCAGLPSNPDVSRCQDLPAAEFVPLSLDEFVDLHKEYVTLSRCVHKYEFSDLRPDFFGRNLDDKLWHRAIRAGGAEGLFQDVGRLPDYLSPSEAASLDAREMKKRFPEVIWSLQNYAMGAERKQVEALRARAIYTKYTAMGTKGACTPTEAFQRLLDKAAGQGSLAASTH